MINRTALTILFWCLYCTLLGQTSLSFRSIDKTDGLSQSSVFAIAQDSSGFMWFGTRDGLNKYDGYQIEIYQPDQNHNGLVSSDIRSLVYDPHRNGLWIGTANGLSYLNLLTDSFVPIFEKNDTTTIGVSTNWINDIHLDHQKRVWVGTKKGLYCFTDSLGHLVPLPIGASNLEVNEIAQDKNENLWIGTAQGLYKIPRTALDHPQVPLQSFHTRAHPITALAIQALTIDQLGRLWVGTKNKGVYCLDLYQKEIVFHFTESSQRYPLSNNKVRAIVDTKDGQIWVGTFEGLNKIELATGKVLQLFHNPQNIYGLSNNSIKSLFVDDTDNLWIGTYYGGVNYYNPSFNSFQNNLNQQIGSQLSHEIVSSFFEDEAHNLWIGTDGGGLHRIDYQTKKKAYFNQETATASGHIGHHIKSITADDQWLWIGTYEEGLFRLNKKNYQITSYQCHQEDIHTLGHDNVYGLFKEGKYLWVATYGGGISLYNEQTNQFTRIKSASQNPNSLSSDYCRTIYKDQRHTVWIGTDHGLNRVDQFDKEGFPTSFHQYLDSMAIYVIYQSKSDVLWLGTYDHGLVSFNPQNLTIQTYAVNDGLPSNSIMGIVEDEAGYLWLSTLNGLAKFDPVTKTAINYDQRNGIYNLEFNFNAYAKLRNGTILFGGTKGYVAFHPSSIKKNSHTPPLVFTQLEVNNQKIAPNDPTNILQQVINETPSITLKPGQPNFSLQMAALDYFNPNNNQYAYKLDGLESQWNYTTGITQATYTLQKPGQYTFKFKGSNNDGHWNNQIRTLQIIMLPPFWLSSWAITIYVLLLISFLGFLIYFLRVKYQLRLQQLEKEQQEKLHQVKLNFLTNLTHELKTPLTLILGPLEQILKLNEVSSRVKDQLMGMKHNTQRLLNLTNQILVFQKIEQEHLKVQAAATNLVQFIEEIYLVFKDHAQSRGITYEFHTPMEQFEVWIDEDKLEKVFYNLLSNAFKYTPDGGKITLFIKPIKNRVCVEVQDSGVGIDPKLHQQIFKRFYEKESYFPHAFKGTGIGLALSKQMIEMHRGHISVESNIGQGTLIKVELPRGKKHFTSEELIDDLHNPPFEKLTTRLNEYDGELVSSSKNWLPQSKQKMKLLIAEDDRELLEYLKSIFSEQFTVIQAENGDIAWSIVQSQQPDLIISDVLMPGTDGITLCRKVKTDLAYSHIPIILLTARNTHHYQMEGLRIGADDYITKPFSPSVLLQKVINLIRTRYYLQLKFKRVLNFEPKEVTLTSADEQFLEQAMQTVEIHMNNPSFGVEQFAYEMAVSRSLLFNKLKALTGMTPNNFVKSIRLKRAAHLLKQQKINVAEVAGEVGFRDPKYFSKCFQKQFKQTPSEFSNQP